MPFLGLVVCKHTQLYTMYEAFGNQASATQASPSLTIKTPKPPHPLCSLAHDVALRIHAHVHTCLPESLIPITALDTYLLLPLQVWLVHLSTRLLKPI